MTHYPKPTMCMACRHAIADCGHLPFSSMPILSKSKHRIIVSCKEYQDARPAPERQASRRNSPQTAAYS